MINHALVKFPIVSGANLFAIYLLVLHSYRGVFFLFVLFVCLFVCFYYQI